LYFQIDKILEVCEDQELASAMLQNQLDRLKTFSATCVQQTEELETKFGRWSDLADHIVRATQEKNGKWMFQSKVSGKETVYWWITVEFKRDSGRLEDEKLSKEEEIKEREIERKDIEAGLLARKQMVEKRMKAVAQAEVQWQAEANPGKLTINPQSMHSNN
jgi:hypothetical protein